MCGAVLQFHVPDFFFSTQKNVFHFPAQNTWPIAVMWLWEVHAVYVVYVVDNG